MCLDRPPVNQVTCTACHESLGPDEVLVYADSSGRDGPAKDPYHLACFLSTLDLSLPSNQPLHDWLTEKATAAFECALRNL